MALNSLVRRERSPLAALFIDFENVYYFLKNQVVTEEDPVEIAYNLIRQLRNHLRDELQLETIVMKAYADFDRIPEQVQRPLYLIGVDTRNVLSTDHKNAADMRLCIDAMETLYVRPNIDTFILMAGDRDYIPLTKHLQENAKEVKSCSFEENASGDLLQVIGKQHFLAANTLIPDVKLKPREPEKPSGPPVIPVDQELTLQSPVSDASRFSPINVNLDDEESLCLEIMLERFGDKHEIWFSPFLRAYAEEVHQLADYERKAIISSLEMKGVLAVERRKGNPFDYSVIILNYNHPMVQKFHPGI